jgi:hypothetical protein
LQKENGKEKKARPKKAAETLTPDEEQIKKLKVRDSNRERKNKIHL